MVPTPGVLLQRIAERLDQEAASADDDRKRWWSDLLRWPVLRPTIAFGAALVAVLLILNRSAGSNVIEQSLENYRAVVNGEMKPEETSGSPEILKSFFTGKTGFQVLVPEMKGCRLLGGLLGEYSAACKRRNNAGKTGAPPVKTASKHCNEVKSSDSSKRSKNAGEATAVCTGLCATCCKTVSDLILPG